tara:strand:+ start:66 stop:761 length:696 start_codon:yes stop_codon:yes gene_type:complete
MYFFLLQLLLLCISAQKIKQITLTNKNFIPIRGTINEQTSSNFIYELNQHQNKSNIFVYLNTNGGSVESGNKILEEIQKYNLSCIAERAYSMGFVLLQGCTKRYITKYSKLMQHQISYGIQNEKEKIDNYARFINEIDYELNKMQAKKLKMDYEDFKLKTLNEWWVFGKNAIENNMADKMVNVFCTSELTKKNYTVEQGPFTYTYSKCPLVSEPLHTKKNNNNAIYFLQYQ